MKKKTIYGVLALSSLLLGSVGFADEHVPLDDSADTVVITPIDVPINQPLEPTPEPIEPPVTDAVDEPSEPDVGPTDPVIVSPIDTPVLDEDKTKEKEPEAPVEPTQGEQETVDKKSETQPITIPTYEEPVVTETGYHVVGTENSQVLPATGEHDAMVLTVSGVISVLAALFMAFRNKVKAFFDKQDEG